MQDWRASGKVVQPFHVRIEDPGPKGLFFDEAMTEDALLEGRQPFRDIIAVNQPEADAHVDRIAESGGIRSEPQLVVGNGARGRARGQSIAVVPRPSTVVNQPSGISAGGDEGGAEQLSGDARLPLHEGAGNFERRPAIAAARAFPAATNFRTGGFAAIDDLRAAAPAFPADHRPLWGARHGTQYDCRPSRFPRCAPKAVAGRQSRQPGHHFCPRSRRTTYSSTDTPIMPAAILSRR